MSPSYINELTCFAFYRHITIFLKIKITYLPISHRSKLICLDSWVLESWVLDIVVAKPAVCLFCFSFYIFSVFAILVSATEEDFLP